jgi:glycosyltransferase involved in cell wall biosynthesis
VAQLTPGRRIAKSVKKLIRPLVPDPIVARLRAPQRSRHNVLILVTDRSERRRWSANTPDTYQVAAAPDGQEARPYTVATDGDPRPGPAEVVVAGDPALVDRYGALVVESLTTHGLDAVVVARVLPPGRGKGMRVEPPTEPLMLATWGVAWGEVGGWPDQQPQVPIIADRLRAAGRRMGLVPLSSDQRPLGRTDPITRPMVAIFAAVPLHDVGGGSRSAQMALELLRRGYQVVYVNSFESTESVDLGLRFLHPNLEQVSLARFDAGVLATRSLVEPKIAILELPLGDLITPVAELGASGFEVVYDLIDDWSATSLGGHWYQPADEQSLVGSARVLVATAPDLVQRLEAISGREVGLIPNGVSEVMFSGDAGQLPVDFPPGEGPVIGFHGSLYGDWFDWVALTRVAASFPQARLLVIGDDRGHPSLPSNVFFLGLKSQSELLSYVSRFDVGIIPFVVSEVTHATSPLKVYEYLAAGVPVAAPPLRSLAGLDGVFVSSDLSEAVRWALWAPKPDRRRALAEHSWGQRLETLFAAAGLELSAVSTEAVVVKRRPAVHHPRHLRIL